MKRRVVVIVVFIVIIVAWWFVVSPKKEKYEASSNCAPGYIQSCISMSIPGGGPMEKSSSNTCPESYFEMCLPDVQYQLTPDNVCPPTYGIHPASRKCAPLSSIKVFNSKKNTQNAT
jgi:hypothetical protein